MESGKWKMERENDGEGLWMGDNDGDESRFVV